MDDTEFERHSGEALKRIESALGDCDADLDCGFVGEGVLEIEFDDGGKIIVNRHAAAREIWVAARSGGFHYHFDGMHWHDTRSGEELFAALARLIGEHGGATVSI